MNTKKSYAVLERKAWGAVLSRALLALLVVGAITLTLAGCGDDEKPKTELEKLPAATQVGKGTFGCLVDGKAWVVKSFVDVPTFYQEGVLQINAQVETNKIDQYIIFIVRADDLTTSQYLLIDNGAALYDLPTSCEYVTSETYQGRLTITHFDNTSFIISGTFEFEAYSEDCSQSVSVTDGRFDLQYAP